MRRAIDSTRSESASARRAAVWVVMASLLQAGAFEIFGEPVELLLPDLAMRLDPGRGVRDRLRLEAAAMDAAVARAAEQPGGLEHLEVLGDRRRRHVEGLAEIADAGLALRQPRDDRTARRVGERG